MISAPGIMASAEGDCLIVVGDEEVVKVHYHTDTPWKVLEYAASQGDLHKIIVENMERQGQTGWMGKVYQDFYVW